MVDGKLVFFDNSNFGDVGVARMDVDEVNADTGFTMSADFDVRTINFTQSKLGLFALAQGPGSYGDGFTGLYAYVQELDTSGNRFRFAVVTGIDGEIVELGASNEFDLTDGSPNFSISLAATSSNDGLSVVARLLEDGEDLVAPINAEIARSGIPVGKSFGLRFNPGFNTLEVAVDEFVIGRATSE